MALHEQTITIHALKFKKADLDSAPEKERLFYLMAGSLSNDLQMLMKTIAVIIESGPNDQHRIANQTDSAFAMLFLRMVAGRLYEGSSLLNKFARMLKSSYEPHFNSESRAAVDRIRKYFGRSDNLMKAVRNKMAFHADVDVAQAAYARIPEHEDIGDYLTPTLGNSMHYTPEIMHYEMLGHLAGGVTHEEGTKQLYEHAKSLVPDFNEYVGAFILAFAERYLADALANLSEETDSVPVCAFEDMKLTFLSALPLRI